VQEAARRHSVYVIFCVRYQRDGKERPFERLLVVGPDGRILLSYDKLWGDARFQNAPGPFVIDGVTCAAAICADRWIRSVEELPALENAQILIECSNNYGAEWLPELGWFWYVPRALRNEVYVIFANTAKENRAAKHDGHGHSAVIAPDGSLVCAAGTESDRLLVARLDLAKATGRQAQLRRNHPAFKAFWDVGLDILHGRAPRGGKVDVPPHDVLRSPAVTLKLAAVQMACSRRVDDNVRRMSELIAKAAAEGADVIVFPELAVTGARAEDILAADDAALQNALRTLQKAARSHRVHVAFGTPWFDAGKRHNAAIVLGPDGNVLTRYAQLVVDRPELFSAGQSTRDLWFRVKGVPGVVTLGRDALWSEIAELAATRGAQLHLHIAYERDTSAEGALRRNQLWVNLASYRTFTATVNAASPAGLAQPSAAAGGGSILWDDFHRGHKGKTGGYGPWSAVKLAEAGSAEEIIYATQQIPQTNPHFRVLTDRTNPQMRPWYATGARVIDPERGGGPLECGAFPPLSFFLSSSCSVGADARDSVVCATDDQTKKRKKAAEKRRTPRAVFRGRIAWSADGNHNDPDDWAASPVALAIFAESGAKDRLVHFDYNSILPQTNAEWEKIHADSVLGAAGRYGYDKSLFHDCRKNLDAAQASIVKAINASSSADPLYFIIAGPMEVPFRAIQKSDHAKRQFVWCISHSRWNDGFAAKYKFTNTKRSVIASGVNWVQIQDQNRLLSKSPYGRPATAEAQWRPYHWMRDSGDPKVRFLWERLQVSTRPDPSDAGMAYFLVTGDEEADPAKLKRLLDDKLAPAPIALRRRVRLEAENFRDLDSYELEDRNDKGASHRLQAALKPGKTAGRIRTRFAEPFTAPKGRYDVDVRFFDAREQRCRFTLLVSGVPQGAAWESPGTGQGWTTQTVANVEIGTGDEIAISTEGTGARLDYVQLKYRMR